MVTLTHNRWAAALAAVLLTAAVSAAQSPAAAEQPGPGGQQGPMVVEPLTYNPVFVPDIRFGEVNGDMSTLLGGYAGVVMDKRLLLGGGAYWMVDNDWDRELFYLGAIVGWTVLGNNNVSLTVSGLIGGGQGTAGIDVEYPAFEQPEVVRFGGRPQHQPPYGGTGRWVVWEDFFVAEPTVSVVWQVSRGFGLSGSVGYRLIAGAGSLNSEFQGVSGSVGFVFGGK
jgi:hypothetical protein